MSRIRVYMKPYDSQGEYKPDYVEVTRDVVSMGAISQQLENSDYDVGVFRESSFSLKLRNDTGKFSGVTNLKSIFRYRRNGVKVKITFDRRDYDLICGFFYPGDFEFLSNEVFVFEGFLNDVSSSSDIEAQSIEFKVLGKESAFDNTLGGVADVNIGDNLSDAIFTALNHPDITDLFTLDVGNINVGTDVAIDSIDGFDSKTVKDALSSFLKLSRSVLTIDEDNVINITSRDAQGVDVYPFFGQASISGIENILNITNYREGLNRLFNFWTWGSTNVNSTDVSSATLYGVFSKDFSDSVIDDGSTAKIQTLLDDVRDEFSLPKVELELETPLAEDVLALAVLSKVNIDYPTVYTPFDDSPLPRYGQVVYGGAKYPYGQWSLTIPTTKTFKIMGRKIDPAKRTIIFKLRETT